MYFSPYLIQKNWNFKLDSLCFCRSSWFIIGVPHIFSTTSLFDKILAIPGYSVRNNYIQQLRVPILINCCITRKILKMPSLIYPRKIQWLSYKGKQLLSSSFNRLFYSIYNKQFIFCKVVMNDDG